MPKQVIEYCCLLISPGDVAEERDALTELVNNWNAQIGKSLLEPGQSRKISLNPLEFTDAQLTDFGCVIMEDQIGRVFRSDTAEMAEVIERVSAKRRLIQR